MNAPNDIRGQLRQLQIPKEQRPVARRASGERGRGWMVALVAIAVCGTGLYVGRERIGQAVGTVAKPAEVRLITVVARREPGAPPVLTATGKIVSDHHVAVSTKVSGQIVALHFEQGDPVKPGQVMARIEDTLYRARRDEAKANLEKSQASLVYRRINFERVSKLYTSVDASVIEYHDAKRWLAEAEAQVSADEAVLAFTQKALDDCEVAAPIAGVILERNVEVGDFVAAEGGRGANANAQFATIADNAKLRVEVDVSELDITRIHREMPCTIVPDAYKDRRYRGWVMWLDPAANYSKATVQVKVRIEEPDDYLRVSGSAQVAFLPQRPAADSTQTRASIWIPKSACVIGADGKSAKVFVVVDGRLKETTITIGLQSAGQVEVLAGLSEAQSIAADGVDELADGQRIKS